MKKMRNRWLCALFGMAMLVNVTACGAVTKEEKPRETESAKQEAEQIAEPEETPVPEETVSIVPEGNDLAEALYMAQDALGLYLYSLKQDKMPLPQSMQPEALILDKDSFVTLVEWDEEAYLRRTSNKAVKKTLTIPEWMNTLAEEKNINFSKTLQEALLEKLEA